MLRLSVPSFKADYFLSSNSLFQFHKEQHEDRPNSDCHGKLRQRGFPHSTSSGQHIRSRHHRESGEHCNNKSFPVHECRSPFPVWDFENGSDCTRVSPARDFECTAFLQQTVTLVHVPT